MCVWSLQLISRPYFTIHLYGYVEALMKNSFAFGWDFPRSWVDPEWTEVLWLNDVLICSFYQYLKLTCSHFCHPAAFCSLASAIQTMWLVILFLRRLNNFVLLNQENPTACEFYCLGLLPHFQVKMACALFPPIFVSFVFNFSSVAQVIWLWQGHCWNGSNATWSWNFRWGWRCRRKWSGTFIHI